MLAHRQEYRRVPWSPETRRRGLTASTETFRPTDWDLGWARGGPVSHPSPIATDQRKPDSSSPGPALRSPDCHPPPLIFASRNGTAAMWMCCGHRRLLASVIRRNAAIGKSSLTVAATNIADGSEAPNPFDVRLVNVRLNGRPLHIMRQWRRPSPARGAALRMFSWVVQGRRAPRRPSSRRPSRFPCLPVPRTEPALSNVAQPAARKPSTNARPTEMPMKQREPE